MFETAKTFAQKRGEELRQELSSFYETLQKSIDAQKIAAESRRDALLNTINQNITNTQNTYQDNARQAYVNKMQSGNQLGEILSRLNLGGSGFGVGEQMGIESSYGQNLAGLQKSRDGQIGDLNLQSVNAEANFNAELSDIDRQFYDNKLALDKYVHEQVQNASVQEPQRIAGPAPVKPTNMVNQSNGLLQWAAGGFQANNVDVKFDEKGGATYIDRVTGRQTTMKPGQNPFTGTFHPDVMTRGVFDKTKVFSNGYQPNNIGGKPLKRGVGKDKDGKTVNFTINYGGNNQTVWTTGGSNYYTWDGANGRYIKVRPLPDGRWQEII